ncbi:MAG: hypothetical protein QW590_00250 [Candidatus Bilamarchaeaceae archaeon]
MAGEFVGAEIAAIVVLASVVLSGIFIGVGRAFGYKRVENFGVEEFFQSIVNGAIIGAFATIVALIDSVSAGIAPGVCGAEDKVISQLTCVFETTSTSMFSLLQELMRLLNTIGYYQTLTLNFDVISIQPFVNLAALSLIFSAETLIVQIILILINLNLEILNFIGANALLFILPIGLVFRTFFATRRVGAFLIGLAIGMYLLYPAFVMMFPSPQTDIENATANITAINNKVYYSAVPIVDLNDNYALAAKLDVMSGRCFDSSSENCQNATHGLRREDVDFVGDMTIASQLSAIAIGKALMYLVVAPLLSLLITVIFVKEITKILGSEIGLDFVRVV